MGDKPTSTLNDPLRSEALAILRRTPCDTLRRASYGGEERTERVVARWADGRQATLAAAQDDRISFALRDHYIAGAATCRDQLRAHLAAHGPPEHITVAWTHRADWEGAPPLDVAARWVFSWAEAAAALDLSGGSLPLDPPAAD